MNDQLASDADAGKEMTGKTIVFSRLSFFTYYRMLFMNSGSSSPSQNPQSRHHHQPRTHRLGHIRQKSICRRKRIQRRQIR
jgi:hypothetical protein